MEDFLALMSKIKGMKFKSLKQTRQRKAQNDRIRSAAVKVKIQLGLGDSKNGIFGLSEFSCISRKH